jgi:hypothetical protein
MPRPGTERSLSANILNKRFARKSINRGLSPKWEEAKKRFPSLLQKVNQKRLRRMEYALETGNFPANGWTPPDPKNRATQNVPPYVQFWKH